MQMDNILDNLIKERAPFIFKQTYFSRALRKLLKKLFKYDETLETANTISSLHYSDVFALLARKYTPNVTISGLDNIPKNDSAIIVSNHPMGPADAIALVSKIYQIRKDVYIFANKVFIDLVPPFKKCMAPLYWDAKNEIHTANKDTLRNLISFVEDGMVGIYFPSGRVAKYRLYKTKEYPWHETPLNISERYGLKIIPVHIKSKNSLIFYLARAIHKNLRDLSQLYELINKQNKHIKIKIGAEIDRKELNSNNKFAIKQLREIVENLG